jgi:hypothetical protein
MGGKMSSISKINEQLISVEGAISKIQKHIDPTFIGIDRIAKYSSTLADLCKAQEALIRTQAIIFVELTESEIDIPVLPLFCEERDSEEGEDEEEGEEESP